MDTRSGKIYSPVATEAIDAADRQYMLQMVYHPTPVQRARQRVGRNDPCPCGSGRKFKKCHLGKRA